MKPSWKTVRHYHHVTSHHPRDEETAQQQPGKKCNGSSARLGSRGRVASFCNRVRSPWRSGLRSRGVSPRGLSPTSDSKFGVEFEFEFGFEVCLASTWTPRNNPLPSRSSLVVAYELSSLCLFIISVSVPSGPFFCLIFGPFSAPFRDPFSLPFRHPGGTRKRASDTTSQKSKTVLSP